MKDSQSKQQKNFHGFSILSMMLIITLASLLFAGFIRLYQNNQQALINVNFNTLSYNPLFSWIFFNDHTNELGFYPFDSAVITKPYDAVTTLFTPGSTLIKVSDADVNGNDTFTLQYHGNDLGNVFNCQGTPLLAHQQTESFYYINEHHDLVCATRNPESALDKAYPVMQNVESMVITLGEDLDNDGLVNRYISAHADTIAYSKIMNIRVSLLLKTNEISSRLTPNQYYNLDGEEKGPYADLFVRKILTTTVPLKKRTDP